MDDKTALITIGAIFWISLAIVFFIVMAPVSRFFAYGWNIRKQEFTNRIDRNKGASAGQSEPIALYLERFWAKTIAKKNWGGKSKSEQFALVYDIIAGLQIYVVPIGLLGASVLLFGGLAIQCAVRTGYEWYVQSYMTTQVAEKAVFTQAIVHLRLEALNAAFEPFPPLMLNMAALTAVAGAYLAVVQSAIYGYKTRTLLSSDLLWASFRLVIAIPMGYAVSGILAAPMGGLVSFGLGAFPISAVVKLLRRLTSGALSKTEADDRDDLLRMTGVTPDVAARLNDEGVFSPSQLANTDPVSLAIRTGLSFDFVLNLVAQSQVWCFVGDTAATMAPLGCGDARMIRRFFTTPITVAAAGAQPTDAQALLAALATATGRDAAALSPVLTVIAQDEFTEFLANL